MRSFVTDLFKRGAFRLYRDCNKLMITSNRMVARVINDKFDSWSLKERNYDAS